jgi:transcriptional antiterminator NusG
MPLQPLRAVSTQVEQEYKWYIIGTYTAMENRVKKNIEIRAKNLDLGNKLIQVLVPTQETSVIKNGEPKVYREKMFPGYIIVYMQLDQYTYDCVKETTGVTSFVTIVDNPEVQISDKFVPSTLCGDEIDLILQYVQSPTKDLNIELSIGDLVEVRGGPMDGKQGPIKRINKSGGSIVISLNVMDSEILTTVPIISVQWVSEGK